jgi:hypothetical protein
MDQEINNPVSKEYPSYEPKKKTGLILTLILGVLVIGSAITIFSISNRYNNQKIANDKLAIENQHLNGKLVGRDSAMNDMIATFDQIENNLSVIKQKRNLLTIQSNDPESRLDKRQAILKDIQMMNSLLEESKKRLASLSHKLKDSGVKIQELENKIAALSADLAARDVDIADLKKFLQDKDFQMAEMNKHLDSIQVVQAKAQDVIKQQDYEINKAFFVNGTYKELKAKGLVAKEGGFLKIGQKKRIQGSLSDKYFTQININETKTIPIHAKKAELMTEHPKSSYTYIQEKGQIAYLEIQNPKEFWKISKYAVVEVK